MSTENAARLLAAPGAPSNTFGARGLLEFGQDCAAHAVLRLPRGRGRPGGPLEMVIDSGGYPQFQETV